jgi:hypothetical protein
VVLRNKQTVRDLQTNPRYSVQHKWPQIAFLAALIVFTLWAIGDSLPRVFSMSVFPITVGCLTIVPLLAVAIGMVGARRPNVFLFDADKDTALVQRHAHGELYYLVWMAALLIASALLGFVISVALFIFIFLRYEARASYTLGALATLGFLLLLAVFGQALVLEYPTGLLQQFVPLPWPFSV